VFTEATPVVCGCLRVCVRVYVHVCVYLCVCSLSSWIGCSIAFFDFDYSSRCHLLVQTVQAIHHPSTTYSWESSWVDRLDAFFTVYFKQLAQFLENTCLSKNEEIAPWRATWLQFKHLTHLENETPGSYYWSNNKSQVYNIESLLLQTQTCTQTATHTATHTATDCNTLQRIATGKDRKTTGQYQIVVIR